MRRNVEVSGKNLEEVLERASKYFEVDRALLGYEVLSENKGFLGIFSPRIVRVRVWIDNGDQAVITIPQGTEKEIHKAEEKIPIKGTYSNPANDTEPVSQEQFNQAREEVRQVFGQLTSRMSMDIEYHVRENEKRILLDINGKDAGILIGKHGETLEAVESFLKILLVKKGFSRIGLEVDISGYRKKRRETLVKLAKKLAGKVTQEKKKIKLEPMVARDRRIIHTILKDHPQVTTYSVGEEPDRRVVVDVKNARKKDGNRRKPNRSRKQPKPE